MRRRQDPPDVVYVEQLTGAMYLDKPEDVEQYEQVMDRLRAESQTPEQTMELLRSALDDMA